MQGLCPSVDFGWARFVGKWLPQVQVSWESNRHWAVKWVDYLLEQGFVSSRNSSGMAVRRLGHVTEGKRAAQAARMSSTPRARLRTLGEALEAPRAEFVMLLSEAWVPPQGPREQSSPWRGLH